MQLRKTCRRDLLILGSIGFLLAFSLSFYFGFNFYIGLIIYGLEGLVLLRQMCTLLTPEKEVHQATHLAKFLFQGFSIFLLGSILVLMSETHYIYQINYMVWVFQLFENKEPIISYEIVTHICLIYIIVILRYKKPLCQLIKVQIMSWFPLAWSFIISIGLIVYTREGFNHFTRLICLVLASILMLMILMFKYQIDKKEPRCYRVNAKHYLMSFITICLGLWMIGYTMPQWSELPGTRWLKSFQRMWATEERLLETFPYQMPLNRDLNLSEAVLFEVETTKPLYLRDTAYAYYEDNTWYMEQEEANIPLKNKYLLAEYEQTSALLSEMSWLNKTVPHLFSELETILNLESTPLIRNQYVINQNPINKYNYLTINGIESIEDDKVEALYYYGKLENIYFYSNKLSEPTNYRVIYEERKPMRGSREYAFLRNLTQEDFIRIYDKLQEYIRKHPYDQGLLPNLPRTYTTMVQFKKAQEHYLQIPRELDKDLTQLAEEITKNLRSDWNKAEAICSYLQEHYTYNLQARSMESEDSIYDFLFEHQQGICQDFASSMVLLCRTLGIPARYVTGYLVTEPKEGVRGTYLVKEKDTHAFVEVYLPAYGWMQFDPTPAREREEAVTSLNQLPFKLNYIGLLKAILVLGSSWILIKVGSYLIKQLLWQVYFMSQSNSICINRLMKKAIKQLEILGYSKKDEETLHQYTKRLTSVGQHIEQLSCYFERDTFGNIPPTNAELRTALQEYQQLFKRNKSKRK